MTAIHLGIREIYTALPHLLLAASALFANHFDLFDQDLLGSKLWLTVRFLVLLVSIFNLLELRVEFYDLFLPFN